MNKAYFNQRDYPKNVPKPINKEYPPVNMPTYDNNRLYDEYGMQQNDVKETEQQKAFIQNAARDRRRLKEHMEGLMCIFFIITSILLVITGLYMFALVYNLNGDYIAVLENGNCGSQMNENKSNCSNSESILNQSQLQVVLRKAHNTIFNPFYFEIIILSLISYSLWFVCCVLTKVLYRQKGNKTGQKRSSLYQNTIMNDISHCKVLILFYIIFVIMKFIVQILCFLIYIFYDGLKPLNLSMYSSFLVIGLLIIMIILQIVLFVISIILRSKLSKYQSQHGSKYQLIE